MFELLRFFTGLSLRERAYIEQLRICQTQMKGKKTIIELTLTGGVTIKGDGSIKFVLQDGTFCLALDGDREVYAHTGDILCLDIQPITEEE